MTARGTALVTGASARIGLAVARRLAAAGYPVVLHASPRSLARAEAEAAALAAEGRPARALAADLAEPAACAGLVAAAGPLTLLVNNAALFESDEAAAPDPALLERHLAVNLRAPVLLAAAFLAQVDASVDPSVVNVIDQRVLRPDPHYFSYTLAKSALWTATRTMAQAFAPRGVRVNAVGPGPVLPNAHEGADGFAHEVETLPLRHSVSPEEVADAVLYLAGARSVTGQMIAVDAGQHIAPARS